MVSFRKYFDRGRVVYDVQPTDDDNEIENDEKKNDEKRRDTRNDCGRIHMIL